MKNINQKNFNNPQNLQLSDSYSTISATLNNPYVSKTIDYGDFRSADPGLNSMLPAIVNHGRVNGNANNMKNVYNGNKNLNLGITSPGTVDNAMEQVGLNFINTNPDYDKLPFKVCLDKFNSQWQIPQMVFNNLMNNLPYTFSALSQEEKNKYLYLMQTFIENESVKNRINIKKKMKNVDIKEDNNKEYFNSINSTNSTNSSCTNSTLSLSGMLSIIIIIVIVLIFLLFIANKNK